MLITYKSQIWIKLVNFLKQTVIYNYRIVETIIIVKLKVVVCVPSGFYEFPEKFRRPHSIAVVFAPGVLSFEQI